MASKSSSATAAGSAAGKKKQAALEISSNIEKLIQDSVEGFGNLDAPQQLKISSVASAAPSSSSSSAASTAHVERVCDVHKGLTDQGFTPHHVERALHALPLSSIGVGTALDWLLLHLDRSDLPKQYADQVQASGDVVVLGTSDAAAQNEDNCNDAAAAGELEAAEQRAKDEQRAREAAAAAVKAKADAEALAKKKAEEEEAEKVARRAWILQYAAGSSSEEEEEEEEGGGGAGSPAGSVIEDWEVWGDPREIERRRAERARGNLPREDRLALISAEMERAKEGAARAKSSGDKGEQRAFGQMIGQLKRELAELGVSEEDLPQPGGGAPQQAQLAQQGGGGESSMVTAGALNDDGAAAIAAEEEEEEEEEGPGFDLFGGGVEELESAPRANEAKAARRRAKAMAAAALQPWGDSAQGGKKRAGGGKRERGAQKPQMEVHQPKAALQQACQRAGWPPPRYERLPPGGGRDPSESSSGDVRYSVTVDPTAGKSSGRKKGGGSGGAPQRRTFVAPETDDGWARIEDAQHAVATLALLSVCGGEQPELWRQLPPPFNELWLQWEEEGEGQAAEEGEGVAAARAAFARELVQEKLQGEEGVEVGESVEDEAANEAAWVERLRGELAAKQRSTRNTAAASDRMLRALQTWRGSIEGAKWHKARSSLPVYALREELRQVLASHDVVVVSGETGSGKTTQVPQFLLEYDVEAGRGGESSVICTQPRRIAAISVAERVAQERGDPAPGEPGGAVGYSVRLDSATTHDTRLLFCTTGILLRRMASDHALASVSHVVVDEVHERTLQGDFIIAILRDLVAARAAAGCPLKLILMSATLDAGMISEYFGGCPALHAAGRTFPVTHLFLEDAIEATGYVLAADAPAAARPSGARGARQKKLTAAAGNRHRATVRSGWGDDEGDEVLNPNYREEYENFSAGTRRSLARLDEDRIDFELLEELVGWIHDTHDPGAVLVFLPGMAEISNLATRLAASRRFADCWVVPLHSTVSPADQRKAFKIPPAGVRKIVIATNIAETSLTIEDVVVVVDSGKLKERRHDPQRSMSLLVEDWVSVASAKQRKGRAGRVREGVCYGMYTRYRFENRMKQYQTPEMARVPLEEFVLQVHLLKVSTSAAGFAARTLQPPPAKAVDGALRVLRDVGALTDGERLTPLGHHLAQLPVDARVGKLLLLASCLGCLSPALSIAACLSHKPPFATGLAAEEGTARARAALAAADSGTLAAGQQSDHLVMGAAVDGWMAARRQGGVKAAREFARKHALSEQTLEMLADMRSQFASMMGDIGFLTSGGGRGGGRKSSSGSGFKGPWFDDPKLPTNRYTQHPAVLKSALLAALYPSIAVMDDSEAGPGRKPAWHDGTGAVAIHPGSMCSGMDAGKFQRPFLTYLEKVRTSQVFLRDCTVVSPAAVLLFGGSLEVDHAAGRVTVDGWLRVRAPARAAALVGKLRGAFEALLRRKAAAPRSQFGEGGGDRVVGAIVELLNYEEAVQGWNK